MILKTKFGLKVLTIIVVLVMIFSGLMPLPQDKTKGVTNVNVMLSDYRPNKTGVKYTITFSTANGPGSHILIHFYKYSGTTWIENNSVVYEGVSQSQITCNGYTVGTILTASRSSGTLMFMVPDTQQSSTYITIIISESANFGNGGPGIYKIDVSTEKETALVDSNTYNISNPKLQSVKVSVDPPYASKNAKYTITATTSNYDSSSLSGGADQIRVQFPSGTSLPSIMDANSISVKYGSTEKFVTTSTSVSGNAVQFTIPSGVSIPSNSPFTVTFYETAHIYNPNLPGDYRLSVETLDSSGGVKDDSTDSEIYTITATSVGNVSVVVEPLQIGASAKYTIIFKTSSSGDLTANSGEIHIKFDEAFYIPPTISTSQITVNDKVPSSVYVVGKEIKIVVAQNIPSNSNVSVVIQSGAGIKNPAQTGTYKISLWTSSDAYPVSSPGIVINPSAVSNVKVTVTPQLAGMKAIYIIVFQTGVSGLLNPGDTITIKFPQGTYIPNSLSNESVRINDKMPGNVSVSGTTVTLSLSSTILPNYTVVIQFSLEAGIKNPSTPKSYKVIVNTSKEQSDVESSSYEIIKGVSTYLNITPSSPDGKNGFYKTNPTVEIKADAPQGLSYTIFYKLDEAPNFEKYQSPIKISDGNHTLSYYALDSYNNKEDTHTASFKVDTIKPPLSITSPSPNKTFYEKNILITGTTEPNVSLSVSAGSIITQLLVDSEGKFQYNFTFPGEGFSTITFTAEDIAGNVNTLDITLRYVFQRNVILVVGTKVAYINGEEVVLTEAPLIYKGRVLVPIRFISETFGAQVLWDSIFKIITINFNNQSLRLQVGNLTADLNGKATTLDVAPMIKNNTTFVPVRFVSEAFGASVDWDPLHGIVKITYPKKSTGN